MDSNISSQLPQELIAHCLRFLTSSKRTHRRDLFSTSLVCRAWLAPSQEILFHDLHITRTIILAYIYSRPHLAPLVRHVHITAIDKHHEPLEIPPFPNLELVSIFNKGYKSVSCKGGRLFRTIESSPVRLRNLVLDSLHFPRIQELAAIFKGSSLKQIEVLQLRDVVVRTQDPDPSLSSDEEQDEDEDLSGGEETSGDEEISKDEEESEIDGVIERQDPLRGLLDIEDPSNVSAMGTISVKELELDSIMDLLSIQLLARSPHSRLRMTSVERLWLQDILPYTIGNLYHSLNDGTFPSLTRLEFAMCNIPDALVSPTSAILSRLTHISAVYSCYPAPHPEGKPQCLLSHLIALPMDFPLNLKTLHLQLGVYRPWRSLPRGFQAQIRSAPVDPAACLSLLDTLLRDVIQRFESLEGIRVYYSAKRFCQNQDIGVALRNACRTGKIALHKLE
ncbi:hypothetical protein Moror_10926 [Moniliophthora roreri MCA 2997]|uniref:F-box domain-containing protein n=2 Tax=Moniliophthora roreri TaxID=221103 RepID=V2X2J0_MONRO|nr:hypothetical protein Moror_10926 [Moniliophthora roreri MCA 2997]KAI3613540.1 hypothetical protein WG66_006136 [Moniliophthora roreri]